MEIGHNILNGRRDGDCENKMVLFEESKNSYLWVFMFLRFMIFFNFNFLFLVKLLPTNRTECTSDLNYYKRCLDYSNDSAL